MKFYPILFQGRPFPNISVPMFLLLAANYAFIAGLVADAFQANQLWKAFWVGASLPALVTTIQVALNLN